MRALWLDRENCSHSVSPKFRRIRRFSEKISNSDKENAMKLGEMQRGISFSLCVCVCVCVCVCGGGLFS